LTEFWIEMSMTPPLKKQEAQGGAAFLFLLSLPRLGGGSAFIRFRRDKSAFVSLRRDKWFSLRIANSAAPVPPQPWRRSEASGEFSGLFASFAI
jgi:hypothetical protein